MVVELTRRQADALFKSVELMMDVLSEGRVSVPVPLAEAAVKLTLAADDLLPVRARRAGASSPRNRRAASRAARPHRTTGV